MAQYPVLISILIIIFGISLSSLANAKNVNFALSPVGVLYGISKFQIDIGASPNVTLGPSVTYMGVSDSNVNGTLWGVGITGNYFIEHNRFTDGIFVNATFEYSFLNIGVAFASGLSLGASFGYSWFWDGGFNLSAGAGAEFSSASTFVQTYNLVPIFPLIQLQVGYAF